MFGRSRRAASAANVLALLMLVVLAVTACSGAQTVGQQTAPSAPAAVPTRSDEQSTIPVPGPPLSDVSSLRGKTVYWIPITSVASVFAVEEKAAREAFASVGVKLQLCDAQATPGVAARCVDQAVGAKAAGIITESLPPEFARQAFDGAVRAKIPLLFVNTADASTPPEWGEMAAALPANFQSLAKLNNDLIVSSSNGQAKVLLVGVTDSSATTTVFDKGMLGDLTEKCPDCRINSVQTSSPSISSLTSLVSAELVKSPDTDYLFVQYDSFAPPAIQAVRQLNRQGSIKLLTMLGQLDGMQRVANGDQFADSGLSWSALGWNQTDIMLRMMLGQDPLVSAHKSPIKTFTSANIADADLTQAGWESGKWQSSDDFRAMYRKLWGATS